MSKKKIILTIIIILVSFSLGLLLGLNLKKDNNKQLQNQNINEEKFENKEDDKVVEEEKEEITKNNLVSYNGWLSVENNTLVNSNHEKIQLKGMSTHGIQWYGDFANYSMIQSLRDEWNSNLFRVAMYTDEGGYIQNRDLKNKLIEIVDNVIKLDI